LTKIWHEKFLTDSVGSFDNKLTLVIILAM